MSAAHALQKWRGMAYNGMTMDTKKSNKRQSPIAYSPQKITMAFLYGFALLFALWGFFNEHTLTLMFLPSSANFSPYQWAALTVTVVCVVAASGIRRYGLPRCMQRDWVLNLLLMIAVCVSPVLLFEMALDPFYHETQKEVSIFQQDDQLGWRMKPNLNEDYGGTPIRTNSIGLRGEEPLNPKPSESKRILFLGDSVIFGLRIAPEANTLPAITASKLEERLSIPIEAINAGVPGYNTYQQYLYFKHEGIHLKPDAVVLCFVMNDPLNTYTHLKYDDYGADSPIAYLQNTPLDAMLKQSSIVQAVQYWKSRLRYERNSRQSAIYDELFSARSLIERAGHEEILSVWKMTKNYLGMIHALCLENDIPFLLAIAPYRFQYKEPNGNTIPQDELMEHTKASEIVTVDLLPPLLEFKENVDSNPNRIFQDYCHFKVDGLRLCAEQIARTMMDHKMLE